MCRKLTCLASLVLLLGAVNSALALGPATNPSPANGATITDTWARLSWQPGIDAVLHHVYFGENFDDVNSGTGGTFQGSQDSTTFIVGLPGFAYPDGLVPGTTYYWRVDEDDGLPVIMIQSLLKGVVWSFTVEPRPVPPVSPSPRNGATKQSINVVMRWEDGGRATSYRVYFGTDSTPDSSEYKGSQTGTSYYPGTLNYSTTYYWRIDATNSSGTTRGNVWRFTTTEPPRPIDGGVKAESPYPHNGAVNVPQSLTLHWRAGDGAIMHNVYFGDSFTNVNSGTGGTFQGSQDSATFVVGFPGFLYPDGLADSTTYYWRVDEVEADGTTIHKGDVWSFTTAFFIVDDDFESFKDEDGWRISDTWAPAGGATGPYTDQTIVFSGEQSMLFEYNNTGNVDYSEAKRTFDPPQDWEDGYVDALILFVYGRTDNGAGTLYIKIEDDAGRAAWVEHPDPDVLLNENWIGWRIPLIEFEFANPDINLNRIMTMSIGVGEPGPPQPLDGLLNDDCVNAIPIGNVTNLRFDTTSATFDGPGHCERAPNIWYVYTATQSRGVTVSLCGSSYDTALAVYDGSNCPPKLEDMIRCNDDFCDKQSEVTFFASAGREYLIEIGGWEGYTGQGVLNISYEEWWPNVPPSNDDLDNAMSVGNVTDLRFDTTYATFDGPGFCMESPNIWYTYYAPYTGNVTVSLCGSSYDSKLAIYRNGSGWYPNEDDLIECNDDFCNTNAQITFTAFAGSHYLIEVGAYNGETGQGVLNISAEVGLANPVLRDGPKLFDNSDSEEQGKLNSDSFVTAGSDFRTLMGTLRWMNNNQPISDATVTLLGTFKNSPPTGSDGFYGVLCQVKQHTNYKANVTAPNLNTHFWVNFGDNWIITYDFMMP